MSDTTNDALTAAHPDGTITVRETPLQAGLRAVREMADDPAPANDVLTIEEHLRTELQAAHDKLDNAKKTLSMIANSSLRLGPENTANMALTLAREALRELDQ